MSKESYFNFTDKLLTESPFYPIFIVLVLLYLILIIIGIVNLTIFAIRKLHKKQLIGVNEEIKTFPLSGKNTAILIFILLSFTFLISIYTSGIKTQASFVIFNLLLECGIIGIILIFLPQIKKEFRFKIQYLRHLWKIYTALIPVSLCAVFINSYIIEKMNLESNLNPAIDLFLSLDNNYLLFLLIIQIAIVGPLAEELLFRGVIYKTLRKKASPQLASIFVSICFALLHKTAQIFIPLFLISLAICYLYEKTQNILEPIIFHSLHNTLTLSFLIILKIMGV